MGGKRGYEDVIIAEELLRGGEKGKKTEFFWMNRAEGCRVC